MYNLIILPKSYSLNDEIVVALKNQNLNFDVILERTDLSLLKIAIKISVFYIIISYVFSIIIFFRIRRQRNMRLIIVRGFLINDWLIRYLQEKRINVTVYQWDGYSNFDYSKFLNKGFRVISFSPFDAQFFGIEYIPLFSDFEKVSKNILHSKFAHVGTFTQNRLNVVKKLLVNETDAAIHMYLPMVGYIKYIARFWTRPLNTSFKKLSKCEMRSIYESSSCVIDIMTLSENSTGRAGVSVNVIRALALGKKVITNNEGILYLGLNDCQYLLTDFNDMQRIIDFVDETHDCKVNFPFTVENWISSVI